MAYDSTAVANYFLDLAHQHKKLLNPMKIQKLVYYAHGWNLALNNNPLIEDVVEAWPYGPVIPSLYHTFKKYGSGRIRGKADQIEITGDSLSSYRIITPSIDDYPDAHLNKQTKELLDTIWEAYGDLTAVQLSNLTHAPGSPWSQVCVDGRMGVDIPDAIIRDYFIAQQAQTT